MLIHSILNIAPASGEVIDQGENWSLHPDFYKYKPRVIAVMPMDNFSLEPEIEKILYHEVFNRLAEKGYARISLEKVRKVVSELGIQTPGQLQAFSPSDLGEKLNSDALLMGRIEQSAAIHAGVYDAIVVSCSLWLQDCKTKQILWTTEQWRTAHRQWQIDPINFFINYSSHENSSKKDRIAWLVKQMFKTLPQGDIRIEYGDLLDKAMEIKAE